MVTFLRPSPMVRSPSATVVVPCYNYGHYLRQLVAGVLDQQGVDVDIIIVDDCSPDGSGDIAASIAAFNPRVSFIRHEHNKGHIQTYNDGLQEATGDYVVLLSADDLLPKNALSRAVALLKHARTLALFTDTHGRLLERPLRLIREYETGPCGTDSNGSELAPCELGRSSQAQKS